MGARRASVTAVAAVVLGVLVVSVLVTWAASIGPSGVLRGDGPERMRAELSETRLAEHSHGERGGAGR